MFLYPLLSIPTLNLITKIYFYISRALITSTFIILVASLDLSTNKVLIITKNKIVPVHVII